MTLFSNLKTRVRSWLLSKRDPSEIFSKYYQSNKWGDPDSRSGKGSNLNTTQAVREALPRMVKTLDAKSFLDLPCGDYFWMRTVDLGVSKYTGGDIVSDLIAENQKQYGRDGVNFEVINLIEGPVPRHDIVFTRDCLVHLSNAHVMDALRNIKASGSTWLITTTNPTVQSNEDIATGHWRALDLTKPPFSFGPPVHTIDESMPGVKGSRSDKSLGVWRVSEIPDY